MSVQANEVVAGVLNPVEERCDRCGARGYILATKLDKSLVFCNHHGNRYELTLIAQGFAVMITEM